jgi:pheromone shutdown protein TraB
MLVGDQEMTSQQVTEVLTKVEHKRSWFMILGWVLLIISIVAIIIYLYMKNFETSSTGLGTW